MKSKKDISYALEMSLNKAVLHSSYEVKQMFNIANVCINASAARDQIIPSHNFSLVAMYFEMTDSVTSN